MEEDTKGPTPDMDPHNKHPTQAMEAQLSNKPRTPDMEPRVSHRDPALDMEYKMYPLQALDMADQAMDQDQVGQVVKGNLKAEDPDHPERYPHSKCPCWNTPKVTSHPLLQVELFSSSSLKREGLKEVSCLLHPISKTLRTTTSLINYHRITRLLTSLVALMALATILISFSLPP